MPESTKKYLAMSRGAVFLIILIVVVAAVIGIWYFKTTMANVEKVTLTTSDGLTLAADYYPVASPEKWFILIHMMPATKESWREFAELAQGVGRASLAIDLRGHGRSQDGPDGYKNFSDADHQKSILDIEAAVDYLKSQGATAGTIRFVGASIGANLALQYIVEHPDFPSASLLSPGLDYRGIRADELVKKLKAGQRVWLVAADDDNNGQNSAWAKQLYEMIDGQVVEKRGTNFKSGGHGTDIFKKVPVLMEKFIDF